MSLRARIALLVGVTVLIASAIGGIGTAISSRNIGRDRIDQELLADASRFPAGGSLLISELQFAFETRRATCDDEGELVRRTEFAGVIRGVGPQIRILPEYASAMQLVRPDGAALAACQTIPITDADYAIASSGTGSRFRTVSMDGSRFRVLTNGIGDLGAIQYARDLDLPEATLQGLGVRIIGFGAIGALLAAAVGWSFARQATRPVHRLSAAAERVARTHDLGERIEVEGDDEIAALAASFNTMLSSLDTSREQQQRLVQDASHELRTPLTSLRTNVELLQRHASIDDATRVQILADIGLELAELTELTAELVESATEVPTNITVATPVDLREVAGDCVERARRRHRREITLHAADTTPTIVTGDAGLLGRAITNLINNATKFSEPDTAIDVIVQGTAIGVEDRGGGIADDDLPHIFDRFYRATSARSAPGSGLGLAIVKQIVEGHGGTVSADNRPGGGANIGFHLPARADIQPD